MENNNSNKVAIVTGASSGIGYATSLALSKAGIRVAVGARRMDRLQEIEKQIVRNGDERRGGEEEIFIQRKLDVTSKSDCDSFVDTVAKKWGRVDILINNAGLMPLSHFKNCKVEEWERMIDVNIKGVLYCTSAVIPYMLDKKIRAYS